MLIVQMGKPRGKVRLSNLFSIIVTGGVGIKDHQVFPEPVIINLTFATSDVEAGVRGQSLDKQGERPQYREANLGGKCPASNPDLMEVWK